jgi:Pyridoxamine 5'-phosphate oxidase
VELNRVQAMELLGSVGYGRIVFTHGALPAVRPVNHLLDDGEIIIRNWPSAKITTTVSPPRHPVVALPGRRPRPDPAAGWSVVATRLAEPITDPARIAHYERVLQPWVAMVMDTVIGIRPEIVTGFRLVEPA